MTRRWGVLVCALVLVVWLGACASVTITPVTQEDRKTPGVRYYESEPYLLVVKETIQLVWLPNYNLGYAVKTRPGLGKADGSVKLADGWRLTEIGAIVDTKIPETISAMADLLKAAGVSALTKGALPKALALEPGLYRLKFNKDRGTFEGVERVF
jgi:nitrogen fixation protein